LALVEVFLQSSDQLLALTVQLESGVLEELEVWLWGWMVRSALEQRVMLERHRPLEYSTTPSP
jgi:hypothetical protein